MKQLQATTFDEAAKEAWPVMFDHEAPVNILEKDGRFFAVLTHELDTMKRDANFPYRVLGVVHPKVSGPIRYPDAATVAKG